MAQSLSAVPILILLISSFLFCYSAVVPEGMLVGLQNDQNLKAEPEFKSEVHNSQGIHRKPKTLQSLMQYFRNSDVFATIRAAMDANNGVRKEWVPLGSLIFRNPLGIRQGQGQGQKNK